MAASAATCALEHIRNPNADYSMPRGLGTMTLLPLCLKVWMWPNPPTKRNHIRNILSPNALTSGGNICLHWVTLQGECEHTSTGISITNTNASCISQPHTSPTHPAPTNSNSFGFELRTLYTLFPSTFITHSEILEQITRTGCARIVFTQAHQYSEMKSIPYVIAQPQRG